MIQITRPKLLTKLILRLPPQLIQEPHRATPCVSSTGFLKLVRYNLSSYSIAGGLPNSRVYVGQTRPFPTFAVLNSNYFKLTTYLASSPFRRQLRHCYSMCFVHDQDQLFFELPTVICFNYSGSLRSPGSTLLRVFRQCNRS